MNETQTLIDDLLAEQGRLSAVERFAEWHEGSEAQARRYRDLIPLSMPGKGQQYAFDVDLDKCSGCKACVTACHALNGLEENEAWREVGLLVNNDWRQPFQRFVTTACHHCVDPACLNGCPVLAYEKDATTGIVHHLDDQCIGCQYCVLKCPYDVPKFSSRLGIVRKCDMCSDRLGAGEPPACVQACPNEAIEISIVDVEAIRKQWSGNLPLTAGTGTNPFLPASPLPDYTLPTTRYHSRLELKPTVVSANHESVHPEKAHPPLTIFLVLSQLAFGLLVFDFMADRIQMLAALVIAAISCAASTLHLGRPLGAWRSFLGLRKSWLSREIVVFGAWVPVLAVLAAIQWKVPGADALEPLRAGLSIGAIVLGGVGVFCSAMIYHDTRREFWKLAFSGPKFFGTALLLGSLGALVLANGQNMGWLCVIAPIAALVKIAVENRITRHLALEDYSPMHKTAVLLTERMGLLHRSQITATFLGGIVGPVILALLASTSATKPALLVVATTAFVLALVGELIERYLYFVAVQPVRMPGTRA